jgi:hypothetical protein
MSILSNLYLTLCIRLDKLVNVSTQANLTRAGETTVKYYLLGKSGLRVSELALGAMNFGTER